MKELELLNQILKNLDNNPEFTMQFFEKPHMRSMLVQDLLKDSVRQCFDTSKPAMELQHRYDQICNRLYETYWHYHYPCHATHFHKHIEEWINCPFTCLQEIIDYLTKITSGVQL